MSLMPWVVIKVWWIINNKIVQLVSIFSYFKSCLSISEAILIFIISGKLDNPICHGLNVYVPPLKFICWNPNSKCDGIRKWGFWEVIRVVRMESLWMVLVPYKGQKRPEFSPSSGWGQRWEPGRRASSDTRSLGALILGFPTTRTARNQWDRRAHVWTPVT